MSDALTGACQCGQVRIEADRVEPTGLVCWCSMCRRISGAAGSPVVLVARAAFRVVAGAEGLASFASSANMLRWHCGTCHAPVYGDVFDRPDFALFVPAGLFDAPRALDGVTFEHIFADDAAPWHAATEVGERHPAAPTSDRLSPSKE